jgi:hypothetical protein
MAFKRGSPSLKNREPRGAPAGAALNGTSSKVRRSTRGSNSTALIERMKEWHQALEKIASEAGDAQCGDIQFLAGMVAIATEDALGDVLLIAC